MAWLNSGIDFTLPGNGGPDCIGFHSTPRRVFETSIGAGLCLAAFFVGYRGHTVPTKLPSNVLISSKNLSRIIGLLCLAMALVYLLEVGYKFITLQAIFSVNPCHCLCLVHIFLILAQKLGGGLIWTYLFRIHLFFLHGPFMAVIFPVTNTLFLPGEIAVYWMEHFLLLVIPVILLRVYTVPKFSLSEWWNWGLMAYGIWGFFHYFFLQPLALWTQANLNSMLCPAITDPFRGPNYKLHAIWHQFVANMVSGFAFYLFGIRETKDKDVAEVEHVLEVEHVAEVELKQKNGFKRNGFIHDEKQLFQN